MVFGDKVKKWIFSAYAQNGYRRAGERTEETFFIEMGELRRSKVLCCKIKFQKWFKIPTKSFKQGNIVPIDGKCLAIVTKYGYNLTYKYSTNHKNMK